MPSNKTCTERVKQCNGETKRSREMGYQNLWEITPINIIPHPLKNACYEVRHAPGLCPRAANITIPLRSFEDEDNKMKHTTVEPVLPALFILEFKAESVDQP